MSNTNRTGAETMTINTHLDIAKVTEIMNSVCGEAHPKWVAAKMLMRRPLRENGVDLSRPLSNDWWSLRADCEKSRGIGRMRLAKNERMLRRFLENDIPCGYGVVEQGVDREARQLRAVEALCDVYLAALAPTTPRPAPSKDVESLAYALSAVLAEV